LEGVLGGTNNQVLNGWVREQELISTRHNPWEWAGFAFLEETSTNLQNWASYLHDQNSLTDVEKSVYKPAPTGPVKDRLYDIIDADKNDKLTVAEIVGALGKPWHAQSIAQLVVKYESEWLYKAEKWNSLDQYMGSPNESWAAEKARIEKLAWWGDLAGKQGVSADGMVWHLHPVGLLACYVSGGSKQLITLAMLKLARPDISQSYCEIILPFLNKYAVLYQVNTALRITHLLSQVGHESGFKIRSENLDYTPVRMRQVFGCRNNLTGYDVHADECIITPRLRPKLWTEEGNYAHNAEALGSYVYAGKMGNGNEASGDGYRYRGRGIIQLTGRSNYLKYTQIHNNADASDPRDFIASPDLIINNVQYGIESAFVWWHMNGVNDKIASSYAKWMPTNVDKHVAEISKVVNGGTIGLAERVSLFEALYDMVRSEVK
jgi:predicted chitinase